MTVREYAKSKGLELVGELSRHTFKKNGCRWICYWDKALNQVHKKMKANVYEVYKWDSENQELIRID